VSEVSHTPPPVAAEKRAGVESDSVGLLIPLAISEEITKTSFQFPILSDKAISKLQRLTKRHVGEEPRVPRFYVTVSDHDIQEFEYVKGISPQLKSAAFPFTRQVVYYKAPSSSPMIFRSEGSEFIRVDNELAQEFCRRIQLKEFDPASAVQINFSSP